MIILQRPSTFLHLFPTWNFFVSTDRSIGGAGTRGDGEHDVVAAEEVGRSVSLQTLILLQVDLEESSLEEEDEPDTPGRTDRTHGTGGGFKDEDLDMEEDSQQDEGVGEDRDPFFLASLDAPVVGDRILLRNTDRLHPHDIVLVILLAFLYNRKHTC